MSDTTPLAKIRRLVRLAFPWFALAGVRTYKVTKVNTDGTIDCDPSTAGLLAPPRLRRLPATSQWLAGVELAPNVGDELLIVYRDHDVARPAIVGFRPLREAAPVSMSVGGLSGPAAARVGDHAGRFLWDAMLFTLYYSPSETAPYVAVLPVPVPGSPTPPPQATPGTAVAITTGSSKVQIS